MIPRRAALIGSFAALFAPAVIRTHGLLMPVKKLVSAPRGIWSIVWGDVLTYDEWETANVLRMRWMTKEELLEFYPTYPI